MESILTSSWTPARGIPARAPAARRAVKALFFMNGALFATWAARVPAVQASLSLSNGQLGLALLAMSLGAVVAMPLAGWLSAHIGSDRVSKISAPVYCALLPVLVLAPNAVGFGLALFCFGAFHGALDVAMNAQAVAVERHYPRPIMSSFHALWSLGGLAGAAMGGVLAAAGLKPLAHFTLATVLLGAVAWIAAPYLLGVERRKAGGPNIEFAAPTFRLPSRALLALGVVALSVMVGEGAMADWSAVYLRNHMGTQDSLAAAGYAAYSIAMATGRLVGDRLAEQMGPVKLVRIGGMIAALGLLAALTVGHVAVALAGFACVGLGFSTIVPLVFSAAGRKPGVAPGMAVASVTTLGYLGFLAGPPVIGFAAELLGLRGALGIIVATSLLVVVLAPTLRPPPHSGSSGKG
jgi:MFS family permease